MTVRRWDPDTHRPIPPELTPLNVATSLAYALCHNGRACVYGSETVLRQGFAVPVCVECGVPQSPPRWAQRWNA